MSAALLLIAFFALLTVFLRGVFKRACAETERQLETHY